MPIKPLDLQTNISQMVEVGRVEHAKLGAIAEQQHVREKESNDKSKLVNTRLDESKKGEKTSIKDEEEKKKNRYKNSLLKKGKTEEKDRPQSVDDKIGRIIDILK
jgi:sRNA-binding protein